MSITSDLIKILRNKGHKVVDRRGKANGGNAHNRSLAVVTKGGQHWDGVVNGTMTGHENHWRNTLEWQDGGCTAFVHNDGTIYINYDFEKRTNGVGNHNTSSLNFCYGGNWSNPLNQAQKNALTDMWTVVINDSRVGIRSFSDILGHKEFPGHADNACPGLDMNIFRRDLLNGKTSGAVNNISPIQAKGAKLVKYETGTFTPATAIKVRNAPSTSAAHTGTLQEGAGVVYDRVYESEGYRWVSYIGNSGSRLYVPYRPLDRINSQWGTFSFSNKESDPNKYISGAELIKYEDGTFTTTDKIKVRNKPTTYARHTGTLQNDVSIVYDRVYEGNGYRWLRSYLGSSGDRLYVPYRTLSGPHNQWGTFSSSQIS